MEIEINLVEDWVNITLAEIEELRKQGFVFDTFKKWKPTRIQELKNRLETLEGKSYQQTKKRFSKEALRDDFNEHLLLSYMGLRHRLIEPIPRNVHYATGFECPGEHKEGLDLLKRKIQQGENLFSHLSRNIFKAQKHDGMLYDWGIQHLHLGIEPDKKHKHLIQGNKLVLYVFFDDSNAYFLCIDNHGRWADESLLKIIHKDFPHVLEPYKFAGVLPSGKIGQKAQERN